MKDERVFHQKPNNRGYYKFQIYTREDGVKKTHVCFYHRLQAYQKYGDAIYQKGIVVRHLNDVKTDNSISNIAIGSYADNVRDIPLEKKKAMNAKRVKTHIARGLMLPIEMREAIRADHEAGLGYKKLKRKYGHSSSGLVYICNNSKH